MAARPVESTVIHADHIHSILPTVQRSGLGATVDPVDCNAADPGNAQQIEVGAF